MVKVRLSDLTETGIYDAGSDNDTRSAVIDPTGQYAYVQDTTLVDGQYNGNSIEKIQLSNMTQVGSVASSTLRSYTLAGSAVIDPSGTYAYYGTSGNPGKILTVRHRLS